MPRTKLDKPIFTLGRVKGKPNLWIRWTDNRSRRVSTGTEDETEAKQLLADHIAGWEAPPPENEQTIKMAIDAYLEFKKEAYKVRGDNVEHYRTPYRSLEFAFTSVHTFFDHMKLSAISAKDGRDFIAKRRKDNISKDKKVFKAPSNATISKELAVLNAALNHVKNEKWVIMVPSMKLPPSPQPHDKYMTPLQVGIFMKHAKISHIKLFSLLALHTLSRKTAILQLKWSQVDMENRKIDFNPPGRTQTSKRRVVVSINNALYTALEDARRGKQTEYVIEYGSKPIIDIKKAFTNVAKCKEVNMPWVTPHVLRHTGATLLAQNGVPLRKIADLMGDTLETTERHYIKHHPDYQKDATDKLGEMYG